MFQQEGEEKGDSDQDDDPDEAEQIEEEDSIPPSRTMSKVEVTEATVDSIVLTGLASEVSPAAAKRQKRSKKLGCLVLVPQADGESAVGQACTHLPAVTCAVACGTAAQLRLHVPADIFKFGSQTQHAQAQPHELPSKIKANPAPMLCLWKNIFCQLLHDSGPVGVRSSRRHCRHGHRR